MPPLDGTMEQPKSPLSRSNSSESDDEFGPSNRAMSNSAAVDGTPNSRKGIHSKSPSPQKQAPSSISSPYSSSSPPVTSPTRTFRGLFLSLNPTTNHGSEHGDHGNEQEDSEYFDADEDDGEEDEVKFDGANSVPFRGLTESVRQIMDLDEVGADKRFYEDVARAFVCCAMRRRKRARYHRSQQNFTASADHAQSDHGEPRAETNIKGVPSASSANSVHSAEGGDCDDFAQLDGESEGTEPSATHTTAHPAHQHSNQPYRVNDGFESDDDKEDDTHLDETTFDFDCMSIHKPGLNDTTASAESMLNRLHLQHEHPPTRHHGKPVTDLMQEFKLEDVRDNDFTGSQNPSANDAMPEKGKTSSPPLQTRDSVTHNEEKKDDGTNVTSSATPKDISNAFPDDDGDDDDVFVDASTDFSPASQPDDSRDVASGHVKDTSSSATEKATSVTNEFPHLTPSNKSSAFPTNAHVNVDDSFGSLPPPGWTPAKTPTGFANVDSHDSLKTKISVDDSFRFASPQSLETDDVGVASSHIPMKSSTAANVPNVDGTNGWTPSEKKMKETQATDDSFGSLPSPSWTPGKPTTTTSPTSKSSSPSSNSSPFNSAASVEKDVASLFGSSPANSNTAFESGAGGSVLFSIGTGAPTKREKMRRKTQTATTLKAVSASPPRATDSSSVSSSNAAAGTAENAKTAVDEAVFKSAAATAAASKAFASATAAAVAAAVAASSPPSGPPPFSSAQGEAATSPSSKFSTSPFVVNLGGVDKSKTTSTAAPTTSTFSSMEEPTAAKVTASSHPHVQFSVGVGGNSRRQAQGPSATVNVGLGATRRSTMASSKRSVGTGSVRKSAPPSMATSAAAAAALFTPTDSFSLFPKSTAGNEENDTTLSPMCVDSPSNGQSNDSPENDAASPFDPASVTFCHGRSSPSNASSATKHHSPRSKRVGATARRTSKPKATTAMRGGLGASAPAQSSSSENRKADSNLSITQEKRNEAMIAIITKRVASLRDAGRSMYHCGNYTESVRKYSNAIAEHTNHETVKREAWPDDVYNETLSVLYGNRAAALVMAGAYDAASNDCRVALRLIPTDVGQLRPDIGPPLCAKLQCRMGRALIKAGRIDEAQKAFDSASETATSALELTKSRDAGSTTPLDSKRQAEHVLNQSMTDALLCLSDVKRVRDAKEGLEKCNIVADVNGALVHVNRALPICPGDTNLHEHKVRLLIQLRLWGDVATHCERMAADAVRLDGIFVRDLATFDRFPGIPVARTLKADHFKQQQQSGAQRSTTTPPPLSSAGVCDVVFRLPSSILPLYLRSLRIEERYVDASRANLALLRHHGDKNPAHSWLSAELDTLERTKLTKEEGDSLFRSGKYELAAERYATCLVIDGCSDRSNKWRNNTTNVGGRLHAVLHCNRAACLMQLGRYREASKECSSALAIHGQYMKARLRRARCSARLGHHAESMGDYQEWIKRVEDARREEHQPVGATPTSSIGGACNFDRAIDVSTDDLEKAKLELADVKRSARETQRQAEEEAAEAEAAASSSSPRDRWYDQNFSSYGKDAYSRRQSWYEQQGDSFRRWDSFGGTSPKKPNRRNNGAAKSWSSSSFSSPGSKTDRRNGTSTQRQDSSKPKRGQEQKQPKSPTSAEKTMSHYEVLQVQRTSTQAEIKKAYHKMALKYHPDKNQEPGAASKFRRIQTAYEILSDERSRRKYDMEVRMRYQYNTWA